MTAKELIDKLDPNTRENLWISLLTVIITLRVVLTGSIARLNHGVLNTVLKDTVSD